MTLHLYCLGRATAVVGDRTVEPNAELLFAGLLVLGLENGRELRRDALAELLWPGVEHTKRDGRLRWLLNRLRSLGLAFDASAGHIALSRENLDADFLTVDELELESIGAVLPGYRPAFSTPLLRWVDEKREVICSEVLRHLLPQLASATRADDWTLVARVASAMQRIDSLNEEAVLTLAEARCRLGGKAQALVGLDAYLDSLGDNRPELQLPAKVLQRRIRKAETDRPKSAEPRFVGRREQLSHISSLLAAARSGNGGALMVTGPAGLGKTRLLDEALARNAPAGMQIVRARCEASDLERPLSGFIDLIPQLLELRGALGASPVSFDRLSRFVQPGSEVSVIATHTSPELLRSQLATALLDVLEACSAELPVIVVIDDVQWADQSLGRLWEHVARWSAGHSVAVLFGYRTSIHDHPTFNVPVVPVPSLEPSAAASLLDDLLSDASAALARGDREALLARGGGSPLFLREIVRQWLRTGSVERLPTSLSGLFDAGLAVLSAPAIRALEIAAILGSQATLERIEGVMQLPRSTFIDAIVELDAAGALAADAQGNCCGHVLWADAAMRRVSDPIARVLHRHTAEWLAGEIASHPSAQLLWEIARHWEAAGRPEQARTAILSGAEHLARHGFLTEAANAYGRAAELAADASEQLPLIRRRIELFHTAGRINELGIEIVRHERLAAELHPGYDQHNELEMLQLLVRHWQTGELNGPLRAAASCARDTRLTSAHRLRAAKEAARIANVVEPSLIHELYAIVQQIQPRTRDEHRDRDRVEWEFHMELGDVRMAVPIADRMLVEYADGDQRHDALGLTHCAISYAVVGRIGDARAAFNAALQLTHRHGLLAAAIYAHDELISLSLDFDPPHVTRRLIEEARQPVVAFEMVGAAGNSATFGNHEAQLAIAEGRPTEALRLVFGLDQTLAIPAARWRSHILGIHLAARMALRDNYRIDEIVASLEVCFATFTRWLDWPATVYAEYLKQYRGVENAAAFARRFVSSRRELYPAPAALQELCLETEDILPFKHVRKLPHATDIALSG